MSYSLPSGEYKFSWLLHMLHMLWSKYTAKRLFIPLNRAHSIHLKTSNMLGIDLLFSAIAISNSLRIDI